MFLPPNIILQRIRCIVFGPISSHYGVKEKDILAEIGARFKKARLEADMTQAELAAKVDKDQQSIQRFEKGRMNPTVIYLLEICDGLDVDLSAMLKRL